MADEEVGREVGRAAEALSQEQTVNGVLRTACVELVEALDAEAAAISRVVGDLLVLLAGYRPGSERLDLGHEYLISEYPLTAEAIALGQSRAVSLLDEAPDPMEARLLEQLGFGSLLMVCLPAGQSCWGLVEVYAAGKAFDPGQASVAEEIATLAGRQLETIEH
jgi:GAF domain-containing protein